MGAAGGNNGPVTVPGVGAAPAGPHLSSPPPGPTVPPPGAPIGSPSAIPAGSSAAVGQTGYEDPNTATTAVSYVYYPPYPYPGVSSLI
jgi:hypothetical protein